MKFHIEISLGDGRVHRTVSDWFWEGMTVLKANRLLLVGFGDRIDRFTYHWLANLLEHCNLHCLECTYRFIELGWYNFKVVQTGYITSEVRDRETHQVCNECSNLRVFRHNSGNWTSNWSRNHRFVHCPDQQRANSACLAFTCFLITASSSNSCFLRRCWWRCFPPPTRTISANKSNLL